MKPERRAPVPTEGLQQVQENLVGAVAGPDLLRAHRGPAAREVCREVTSQVRELPVGVAVQARGHGRHGGDDVVDDRRRDGIRVLVGVERDGHVELGCAVGGAAAQVLAQQLLDRPQAGDPAHASSGQTRDDGLAVGREVLGAGEGDDVGARPRAGRPRSTR